MEHTVTVEVRRKIESLHGSIVRLQRMQADEKENYNLSLKSIESRRALEVNKMQNVLDEVEAVKAQVILNLIFFECEPIFKPYKLRVRLNKILQLYDQ